MIPRPNPGRTYPDRNALVEHLFHEGLHLLCVWGGVALEDTDADLEQNIRILDDLGLASMETPRRVS